MDTSTYTLDDQVDIVLHKIALSPNLTMDVHDLYDVNVMNEHTYNLDHFMLEKGLLKIAKDGRTITGKGLEISNFGGWIAYQRILRKEKTRGVHGFETIQQKYEAEIISLKNQIEEQKNELLKNADKETRTVQIINNFIEQNKSAKIIALMAGIVIGLAISSVLWYALF